MQFIDLEAQQRLIKDKIDTNIKKVAFKLINALISERKYDQALLAYKEIISE